MWKTGLVKTRVDFTFPVYLNYDELHAFRIYPAKFAHHIIRRFPTMIADKQDLQIDATFLNHGQWFVEISVGLWKSPANVFVLHFGP